jgi:cytochrome c oxidase assembly protein subunit 15
MVVVIAGTVVTGTGPHGGDEKAQRFAIQATSAVRMHSIAVWCLLALLVYTAVSSRSETLREWNRRVRRVFLAVVVQGAIGYLQWFLDIPAAIVLLHVLGSVLVVLAISDLAIISWIGIARADGKAVHGEDPPR